MRALVIGCGSIGSRRARILKSLGVEVVLTDKDQSKMLRVANEIGIKVILLPDGRGFDIALICTPPSSHLDIAIRVAGDGCHLFIEKPLSNSLDKKKIAQLVYKMQVNGIIGIIGQSYRFCPSLVEWRKQIINKPLLYGSINSGQHIKDWTPGYDYHSSIYASKENGGIVLSSLAHSIDQAQWLFGEIYAISGLISGSEGLGIDVDDNLTLLLRMKSGAQVIIHNDFWQLPWKNEISATTTGLDTEIQGNSTTWGLKPKDVDAMYLEEMKHLVKCIENKYQGQPDISQSILNLEWMEAAQLSSNNGEWWQVDDFWKEVTGRK